MSMLRRAALNFPNPSRCYETAERGVRFWGYDQTFEISFFVEEGALSKINPGTTADKIGFRSIFYARLDLIHEVAGSIYCRRCKATYTFSYTLMDSDF